MKTNRLSLWIGATMVSLAFMFVAAEIMVRIFNLIEANRIKELAEPHDRRIYREEGLYQPDEILGWVHRKNIAIKQGHVDFQVTYNIDSQGSRVTTGGNPQGTKVAVYGDSFTFGVGVADNQTWVSMLNAFLPQAFIMNKGISGHSPDQYLVHLQQDLQDPVEKPEVVIFGILPTNDFPDLNYSLIVAGDGIVKKPYLVKNESGFEILLPKDNDRPIGKTATVEKESALSLMEKKIGVLRNSELLRFLYKQILEFPNEHNEKARAERKLIEVQESQERFDHVVKQVQKLPVKAVYLVIPSEHLLLDNTQTSENVAYDSVIEVLKNNNANFVDMRKILPLEKGLYFAEGHWNEKGSMYAARALYDIILKEKILK